MLKKFDRTVARVLMQCNGYPVCVEVCPTGTLQFVTIDNDMAERQKQGQEKLAKLLTSLG